VGKSVLLIVVDNAAHRALFNKFLKTTPHSLVFAVDGEDGYDRFGEIKPDLVIAHVNASRLDGTILCQLIRKQPGGSDIPFVLIGEEFVDPVEGEVRKKAVGADAFLPVPFTKTMLVQCITPLLAFGRPAKEDDTGVTPAAFDDPDPPTAPLAEQTDEIPVRHEESDLDTVVSFKNPFYRPEVDGSADFPAMLDGGATEMHLDAAPLESARKLADPAERSQRAIQSADEVPTGPDHVDPLVEPKIDTGVRRVDRPTGSDLIQEPVREKTPSASNEQRVAAVGPRRGLDESQLGKRLAKRVRAMHKQLERVDYYQLLGLDPSASLQQITDAYFEHSLEFHPDRFFLLRSGDLKEKIYEVYRRVGQAYRILSDERARKRYDAERAEGAIPPAPPEIIRPNEPKRANGLAVGTQTIEAQRYVSLASEAMSEGDLNGARLHLHLALAYERSNSELRDAIADVARRMRPR
jgi:CheY-like chemotaxis protein